MKKHQTVIISKIPMDKILQIIIDDTSVRIDTNKTFLFYQKVNFLNRVERYRKEE